jgi:hypothetical protein
LAARTWSLARRRPAGRWGYPPADAAQRHRHRRGERQARDRRHGGGGASV